MASKLAATRHCKIIGTLGPASSNEATLRSLIMEMFGGPATREACARLLQAAGLRREWGNLQTGDNEIWVRDGAEVHVPVPVLHEAHAR